MFTQFALLCPVAVTHRAVPSRNEQKSVLGPCWGHVGAKLGPSWGHVGAMLGPSWGHVGFCLLVSFSVNFWADFWRLLGAHVGAMLEAKTIKNRKKGDLESFL